MAATELPDALVPLVRFGRELRSRGLPVGTGRILTFCRAAAALGPLDRDRLYWAGRVSLVGRREDIERYDEAFEEWMRRGASRLQPTIELELPAGVESGGPGELPEDIKVELGLETAEWSHAAEGD